MIEANYFDKVESVAQYIKKCSKPFGGIQLILCGDFLQLPPVMKGAKDKKKFCFQVCHPFFNLLVASINQHIYLYLHRL